MNYVINDSFNRMNPLSIGGSRFLFIKTKPSLFFGTLKLKTAHGITLHYSSLEKTILDMIYLRKKIYLREYNISKSRLSDYSRHYDKRTRESVLSVISNGNEKA